MNELQKNSFQNEHFNGKNGKCSIARILVYVET